MKRTGTFRAILIAAALTATMPTSGCRTLRGLAYLFSPWPTGTTVRAEFEGLAGHSVAVVVYADENMQYQYPLVQLNLSALIGAELRGNVKGVTVIEPRKVVSYQKRNVHWDEMDRTALGKALGAEYVLSVALIEFATVEEGYLDLLRGRITGQGRLYQTNLPEQQACVWRGKDIRVSFPKTPTARAGNNEGAIRLTVMRMFARRLGQKFYKHTEEIED